MHEDVGKYAASCGLDLLICSGSLCEFMAKAARRGNPHLPVIYEPDGGPCRNTCATISGKGTPFW